MSRWQWSVLKMCCLLALKNSLKVINVKNFIVVIFCDAIKVIIVKLCRIIVLIELYLLTSLRVILIVFQDHNGIKQLKFELFRTLYTQCYSLHDFNCDWSVPVHYQFRWPCLWWTLLQPLEPCSLVDMALILLFCTLLFFFFRWNKIILE